MQKILNNLYNYNCLKYDEAKTILKEIASEKYSIAEMSSFLTAFKMKGINIEELKGFRDALLELSIAVDLGDENMIDVCGTGGDGKNTFNISTLSAFIIAGTGNKVVKHGNYAVSSGSGSSDMFEAFGYIFSNNEQKLRNELKEANICYMHAPLFHPAMKAVGPVRKSLKVKTFFNMLGPLVNPSRPKSQMMGVYSMDVFRLYNYLHQNSNKNYSIVHSIDGYDEISLTSDFKIATKYGETIYSPEDIGFKKIDSKEIKGGDNLNQATKIFLNILEGKGTEAQNNVVIANTAFALQCMLEKNIDICIEIARESLLNKKGFDSFNKLMGIQKIN